MRLIEINELSHSFVNKSLFNKASLMIQDSEHIGLVGPNGSGKSTLFKILLGEVVPDDGEIIFDGKLKLGYLDQYADINKDVTMYEYLDDAFAELYELDAKVNQLYDNIENYSDDEEKQMKMITTGQKYSDILYEEEFDLRENKIINVVRGLGLNIEERDKNITQFSGGQKTKLMLAKLLLQKNDLLLLDEPTNFLDIKYIGWLASYLTTIKGAYVVISHDKAFLNKISTKIIEIANRVLKVYIGNYDYYVAEKKKREEMQLQQHIAQDKYIQRSEEYVEAHYYNNTTGNGKTKATWLKKMLERLERIEKPDEIVKPEFKFKFMGKLPKLVMELKNIEIGYTEPILPPISLKLEKGEKCVIRGFNGIGKTTLLKTISLELDLLSGEIYHGEGIEYVFLKQEEDYENNFSSFDKLKKKTLGIKKGKAREITVIEFITEYYPDKSQAEIRSALSRCGIKGEMLFSRVRTLSGGEMTKLRLCIAMLREVNMIILDEPTNHLDVYSKDVLINALSEFEGNVLLTSHDVNFDISWATKIINLEELFD